MAEEDLKRLRVRRGHIKKTITRLETFVNDTAILMTGGEVMIQERRNKLVSTYKEYEEVNTEISLLDDTDSENVSLVEEKYFNVLVKLNQTLKDLKAKEVKPCTDISASKLPNIQIPSFDGKDFTQFKPFMDLFEAVFDTNKSLSNVQKLFYLRHYLTSDALSVIINLPVVNESYSEALTLLKKRYDNKARLIANHINILLDLPSMQRGTATAIRSLVSDSQQQLYALKNLGEAVDKWDMLLISIITRKLDSYTNRAYHLERVDLNKNPTMKEFISFLEKRAKALEDSSPNVNTSNDSTQKPNQSKNSNVKTTNVVSSNHKRALCSFCEKQNHPVFMCPKFKLAPVEGRIKFIEDTNRCKICLNIHPNKCKFSFKCKMCKNPHNTLLHDEKPEEEVTMCSKQCNDEVLLPTVKVKLIDKYGREVFCKALLDSASQGSFIIQSLADKLQLNVQTNNKHTTVVGFGKRSSYLNKTVNLSVYSCAHDLKFSIKDCHVVENITSQLPHKYLDTSKLNIPKEINLGDVNFNVPSEISVLLGASVYFKSILDERIKLKSGPVLQNTLFGYIVGGNVDCNQPNNSGNIISTNFVTCENKNKLDNIMNQFWLSEKMPEEPVKDSSEFEKAEQSFQSSVVLENNKFSVDMPLTRTLDKLEIGDSFSAALQRFLSLENKFKKDHEYYEKYKTFIHEYLKLGHAKIVDINSYDVYGALVYFLSHHAVLNEDSITTLFRVVFNGSMLSKLGISLNDILLNGPVIQNELFDILLIFRTYLYVLITDIKKMFRQILINQHHRPLQNILWRDHPSEPILCLQLQTVTYGLKCSTFLSARCLLELANRFHNKYPLAAQAIKTNTYVDDILCGSNQIETLHELKNQLIGLLKEGGFTLHKWCSNHSEVLNDVPADQRYFDQIELNRDNVVKTLGLKCDIISDKLTFLCPPFNESELCTKRKILSFIGRMFDPLGLIAPIIILFKIYMQKLYALKLDWDSIVPSQEMVEFNKLLLSLKDMKAIEVPRCVTSTEVESIQIVGYADASFKGFGCCLYLRTLCKDGTVKVELLCAKSRVAPLSRSHTIPQLELNSALLLAQLASRAKTSLKNQYADIPVFLYSDSQIVLYWIYSNSIKGKPYVSNRVKKIKDLTTNCMWSFVKTSDNPADLLSRGVDPDKLNNCLKWWHGPQYLANIEYQHSAFQIASPLEDILPTDVESKDDVVDSTSKLQCNFCKIEHGFNIFDRYSDFNKLQTQVAYILRFKHNAKKGSVRNTGTLSPQEYSEALKVIILYNQSIFFSNEINSLLNNKPCKTSLCSLHPFLDNDKILRVGGRLTNAPNIHYDKMHPIILPKSSNLTKMMILKEHKRLLHAGAKLVLSSLSQKYWILSGLREIKKVLHPCIKCFRIKAEGAKVLMGSLPSNRVTANRAFQVVGVDFCGPFNLKVARIRKPMINKAYIAVYVCFSTKAVHVELLSSLTTDAFLACLKRFISRRGLPNFIYCDNAKTFKGAENQLKDLYKLQASPSHRNSVYKFCLTNYIQFKFIPSYSPEFGGLWEAGVKSLKYHFKRIVGDIALTYEELYTVITQIEAVLNSRPLCPLSSDISDLNYLSPGHFLIGTQMTSYPEINYTNINANRLKFWNLCTKLKQNFWSVWHRDYLNQLQNRTKWKHGNVNLRIGDLVIVKLSNVAPMKWPMGRIVKVVPGPDGKVRVAHVKMADKVYVRSYRTLCPLPLCE